MNKRLVTILLIGLMVAATLIYFFYQPKQKNEVEEIVPASWETNYKYDSRDPYGVYLFYELLKASTFSFEKVEGDPTDVLKSYSSGRNKLYVVCSYTYPDYNYVWKELDKFIENGNSVLFILDEDPNSLEEFYRGVFEVKGNRDTLTKLYFTEGRREAYEFERLEEFKRKNHDWNYFMLNESLWIEKSSESSYPGAYHVTGNDLSYYFYSHEENKNGRPVYIEIPYGKGSIFIHRTPIAFTNISLLEEKNVEHLEKILSEIEYDGIIYNTPKPPVPPQKSPKERKSPLQFILADPSLSWAYYITMGCLLLFMIFNTKRKQNAIPLVPKKDNSTLEFVDALSKIYYQKHNNKNIVKHKYRIFITFIRTHYHLNFVKDATEFARVISRKSGVDLKAVQELLTLLDRYGKLNEISDEQLIGLHKQLDNFYKTCK
jgi:hypothetical protein